MGNGLTVQFRSIRLSHVTRPSDETKFGPCHRSQGYMTNGLMSQSPKYSNFACSGAQSDEILQLSQLSSQGDEIKISSGVSQSHRGDKLIEIGQYYRKV